MSSSGQFLHPPTHRTVNPAETPVSRPATPDLRHMATCSGDPVVRVLEHYWGFHDFRPLQREAIGAILGRRDSVVVLPTGGGKSLCFQAPALVADDTAPGRLALVVSPLLSGGKNAQR